MRLLCCHLLLACTTLPLPVVTVLFMPATKSYYVCAEPAYGWTPQIGAGLPITTAVQHGGEAVLFTFLHRIEPQTKLLRLSRQLRGQNSLPYTSESGSHENSSLASCKPNPHQVQRPSV